MLREVQVPARYFRFFPGDSPLGETQTSVQLELRQTALLLVDVYQAAHDLRSRDLVNGAWDAAFEEIVDHPLARVVAATRAAGVPVIYVMNSSPGIAMAESALGRHMRESLGFAPEIEFREADVDPLEYTRGETVQLWIPKQIAPRSNDYYVRKHTYSGFFETRLDSLLRNLAIRTLLCAGFVADCCLSLTMSDASFRGYRVVLLRDCTLATELPDEIGEFRNTRRTITWIESFLGPSAMSADLVTALRGQGGRGGGFSGAANPSG